MRQRKKGPLKPYRDEFGHTLLSDDEELPWGGGRLIIGTGAYGSPLVLGRRDRRSRLHPMTAAVAKSVVE